MNTRGFQIFDCVFKGALNFVNQYVVEMYSMKPILHTATTTFQIRFMKLTPPWTS